MKPASLLCNRALFSKKLFAEKDILITHQTPTHAGVILRGAACYTWLPNFAGPRPLYLGCDRCMVEQGHERHPAEGVAEQGRHQE